jgi:two-component system phosphate regulon response regulator OmpR
MAEADDRISGLEAGADDYLVKPFEPRELVLRIHAILRRTTAQTQRQARISFGEYEFDLQSSRLQKSGELVALTTGESQLLKALAEKAGESVSRTELAKALGGDSSERNVDVHITRLRKKIEAGSSRPLYIQTVRGAGYVLHADR